MRLFAAVPVSEPACGEVIRALGLLKALDWPVRWVREDGPHITVKFFGEVPVERFEVIEEALRHATAGAKALSLRLSRIGAFPTERRPRVLWAGVEENAEFTALRERVEACADEIGFAPEGVPFRPHVTLGRLREGQRLPPRALAEQSRLLDPLPFTASELVLFESVLTADGPQYAARATFSFGS